ncbi:hypothetical protein JMJ56_31285 [Belnapia sp. T18]|uniref:SPOR domain-containing protein n=1 Tax=Belnapia arida TaxID=2804533 RepID=A0ABS1UCP2_9PROT|nr:hypothetical protein [Belnapia arida]MBL6082452.1 hypothetical protein [Belnapia arida]
MWSKRLPSGGGMSALAFGGTQRRNSYPVLVAAAFLWCCLAFLTFSTFLGSGTAKRPSLDDWPTGLAQAGFPATMTHDPAPKSGQAWANAVSPPRLTVAPQRHELAQPDPVALPSLVAGRDAPHAGQEKVGEGSLTPSKPMVRIHHRHGSYAGREAAMRIAQELRKAGADLVSINAEPRVPAIRRLQYSSQADLAEANAFVHRFRHRWGNTWQVDLLDGGASRRQFEIWLPHR